jgi:hypothetical protein
VGSEALAPVAAEETRGASSDSLDVGSWGKDSCDSFDDSSPSMDISEMRGVVSGVEAFVTAAAGNRDDEAPTPPAP